MVKFSFNHGALCEMLRAANDEQLANVVNDVQKIQKERKIQKQAMHVAAIKNAISAAVQDGYMVEISTIGDLEYPDCIVHTNNILYTTIGVEEDK